MAEEPEHWSDLFFRGVDEAGVKPRAWQFLFWGALALGSYLLARWFWYDWPWSYFPRFVMLVPASVGLFSVWTLFLLVLGWFDKGLA
jgi:hypothetical protein